MTFECLESIGRRVRTGGAFWTGDPRQSLGGLHSVRRTLNRPAGRATVRCRRTLPFRIQTPNLVPVVVGEDEAGNIPAADAAGRLDVLCRSKRLAVDDHERQARHVDADGHHVGREYGVKTIVVIPALRQSLKCLGILLGGPSARELSLGGIVGPCLGRIDTGHVDADGMQHPGRVPIQRGDSQTRSTRACRSQELAAQPRDEIVSVFDVHHEWWCEYQAHSPVALYLAVTSPSGFSARRAESSSGPVETLVAVA